MKNFFKQRYDINADNGFNLAVILAVLFYTSSIGSASLLYGRDYFVTIFIAGVFACVFNWSQGEKHGWDWYEVLYTCAGALLGVICTRAAIHVFGFSYWYITAALALELINVYRWNRFKFNTKK